MFCSVRDGHWTVGKFPKKYTSGGIFGLHKTRFLKVCKTLKGIVSRGIGTLFLISLDRFEGRNRAGSGLFFILMTFSCLNFKNYAYAVKFLRGKESWTYYHPEDFSSADCQHSPSMG
jgi:hypothetical protein